ncbi:hypothetical protein [Enterococcus sp. LJL90]
MDQEKKYLVLYDSGQRKYLGEQLKDGEPPLLVTRIEDAWQFPLSKADEAWYLAYKAAWCDMGKFFVHGV